MFLRYTYLPGTRKLRKYNMCFVASGQDDETYGSGKTLFMVAAAFDNWEKYKIIYANFHLDSDVIQNFVYIEPNEISGKSILGLKDNSLLLLQESLYYMDRRNHAAKFCNEIYRALCQIRKKPIDVICDIPKLDYLEFRYVQSASQFWNAYGNPHYLHPVYDPFFYYAEMKKIKTRFSSQSFFREKNKYMRNMSRYYPLYNTNENSIVDTKEEKSIKKSKNSNNQQYTKILKDFG